MTNPLQQLFTELFDNRPTYPTAPGYQRTDTSKQAAEDMKGKATGLRAVVLSALRTAPMTTYELTIATGKSYRSIQPRTSELRAMDLIEDSGTRRIDPETGKNTIVWRTIND